MHQVRRYFVNWSLSNRFRRVEVGVGVAYGTDVGQVMELLLQAGRAHDLVSAEPAPSVLFVGFGDSSLDFELRCWVKDLDDTLQVASDLRVAIEKTLDQQGIEIPFPQRDLHLVGDATAESATEGAPTSGSAEPDRE